MIPPDYPLGTSPGEELVFDALRPPRIAKEWTVLHSLHLPEHVRQIEGEADFVILMPGLGVLCVEVKSHLKADYQNGAWYLGNSASPDYRGPFRQAEGVSRSLKKKVQSALPEGRGIIFWPAVIFTHCSPNVTASTGDWHPWQSLTAADLERKPLPLLLEGVMERARSHVSKVPGGRWFDPTGSAPSKSDCEAIRRLLRPDLHFLPALSAIRQRRADEIRKFTEEQVDVIEGLDGVNERALIEGPAGTGKTVLAFEEARRANLEDDRVLLLCYNKQLARHLRAEAKGMGLDKVVVSTFHSLLQNIASVQGPLFHSEVSETEYWSRLLPELALTVLVEEGPRFDFLIVDEAQDLAHSGYLDVLDALLEKELSGGRWRMFGDFHHQALFGGAAKESIERILSRAPDIARFKLLRNCRNTPRIAEYVVRLGGMDPGYSRILRPDAGPAGTPKTSFYRNANHQLSLLKVVLNELVAAGDFDAEDIVILSPLVASCAKRLASSGDGFALEPLPGRRRGASSFGTVAAFKGLEAPAIVLTDIEEVGTEQSRQLFYVGTSRGTDRLRVLARDGLQHKFARIMTGSLKGDGLEYA
jgi:hypothetical protein